MTVWEELKARGLIAQVTDEDEIKEMVNNGKATFYIGFDPTADSLHARQAPPSSTVSIMPRLPEVSSVWMSAAVRTCIKIGRAHV